MVARATGREMGNRLPVMSKPPARERLAEAAFALFDERGYEQTTVDDITERAGLGRTTFFRHYRSKEDVIFPDHDRLLEQIADRLRTSSHGTALVAVSDAVRLVLLHYIDEGDLARRRYALTSTVPALRDREIASVARYQRLFREFIAGWMADTAEPASPSSVTSTALWAPIDKALRIDSAAFAGPIDKMVTSPPCASAIFRPSSIAYSSSSLISPSGVSLSSVPSPARSVRSTAVSGTCLTQTTIFINDTCLSCLTGHSVSCG